MKMCSCRSVFRPPWMRWRFGASGKSGEPRSGTRVAKVHALCRRVGDTLRKVPPRNPQVVPGRGDDAQRAPLVRHVGLGVEDDLVLLAQFLGDARVDLLQL